MAWWNRKQERSISISDPILAQYFGVGTQNFTGINIGERTALGLSAVWRAVSLISGTVSGLPLHTLRDVDGVRTRMNSFLDDPGAPIGQTRFEWCEQILLHLLLHGNAYLAHVFNGAGGLAGLVPIHPMAVTVERDSQLAEGKRFRVSLDNGQQQLFTPDTMTQIMGLSLDGLYGLSPISIARNSLGTAVAGDRAAASMFANGPMIAGLVTPEEDVTEAEARQIKEGLDRKFTGHENAGAVAVINRKLKFQPWTMSHEDAQWLETRQFSIQEVARWFGVPANLLMDPGAVSTWGTGVEIQNRGLARFTLAPWTARIEQRLSALLPSPRFVEFDFAGLVKPDPGQEISLLIQEVGAGLITVNEARKIRGMDPIEGGDALRVPGQTVTSQPTDLEAVPA